MKITKENIEYFIFEYHEGNLSDSDKAEVLNFIHHHPEYENDFTHWAQSYLHAGDSVTNYGLADKLLQKDVIHWYSNKWFAISSGIAVFTIGLYSYLTFTNPKMTTTEAVPVVSSQQIKQTQHTNNGTIIIDGGTSGEKKKNEQAVILTATSTATPLPVAAESKVNTAANSNTVNRNSSQTQVNTTSGNQTLTTAETETTVPDKKDAVSKNDTIQTIPATKQNDQVKTKKLPVKHKSGLNLKPENKFIPTNPDF